MKRKINLYFFILAFAATFVAVILANMVTYTLLQKEVYADLEGCAYALKAAGAFDDPTQISYQPDEESFRVTLVAADGEVWYDSEADVSALSNHAKRQEIAAALKDGKGKAVRQSATLKKDTYYYAIRLENGYVLRLAKEADSMMHIFVSSFPYFALIIGGVLFISFCFSHILTKKIIEPIRQIAGDVNHTDERFVYRELRPFVRTIRAQHESIIRNADMRQEFTANVSHELKTPLTAISGYAEIIENGMASEDDTFRFAGEIHRNANRLLELINDTIRLSELDASGMEAPLSVLDLYHVASNCVNTLSVKAEKMQVSLRIVGEQCVLRANPEMMNELLYNLCDNAIRYNNKNGRVLVLVGVNSEGQRYIEVKDTGIGIPKEHQERIFERFYRVDKSRSKETGGTGLGLAIVKHIVAQNNAVLQLESEVGKGTRIVVTFPLSMNASPEALAENEA